MKVERGLGRTRSRALLDTLCVANKELFVILSRAARFSNSFAHTDCEALGSKRTNEKNDVTTTRCSRIPPNLALREQSFCGARRDEGSIGTRLFFSKRV